MLKSNNSYIHVFSMLLLFGLLLLPELSFASGSGMPWEGPLAQLRASITGPVAFAIALIAIVVAGGMLIFGGELSEFARRAIMLVLVLGFLVAGAAFLELTFGSASAVLG